MRASSLLPCPSVEKATTLAECEPGRSGTSALEDCFAFAINGLTMNLAVGHRSWSTEPFDGPLEGKLAEIQSRPSGAQGKPAFGREGEDLDRCGGECRGVWTRDD